MADKDIQVRTVQERSIDGVGERSAPVETSKEAAGGFGILKPGRGYWVRVLTAVALGTLFLATALWAASQLEAYSPPIRAWTVRITNIHGAMPAAGQAIDLAKIEDNRPVKIGSGVVESVATEGESAARVTIRDVLLVNKDDSAAETKRITVESSTAGAEPVFTGQVSTTPAPEYAFQRVYVQAGAAALIVLTGLFLIYRYVGNRPGSVDFLIATDEEMRKVNWSTRKIIMDSTMVVISATFFIATLIFLADLVLKQVLLNQFVGR